MRTRDENFNLQTTSTVIITPHAAIDDLLVTCI